MEVVKNHDYYSISSFTAMLFEILVPIVIANIPVTVDIQSQFYLRWNDRSNIEFHGSP